MQTPCVLAAAGCDLYLCHVFAESFCGVCVCVSKGVVLCLPSSPAVPLLALWLWLAYMVCLEIGGDGFHRRIADSVSSRRVLVVRQRGAVHHSHSRHVGVPLV